MNKGVDRKRQESSFVRYMKRTYKNKLCAIAMIIIGLIATSVLKEMSWMLFVSIMAVTLFFAKEDMFED